MKNNYWNNFYKKFNLKKPTLFAIFNKQRPNVCRLILKKN